MTEHLPLMTASELIREADPRSISPWIVPDLVPVGLTLLVGRPYGGQSSLGLFLAAAHAAGQSFLGAGIQPCPRVLYVAPGREPSMLRERLRVLGNEFGGVQTLEHLDVAEGWTKNEEESLEYLAGWMRSYRGGLVVVDGLAYHWSREALQRLRELGHCFDVAVVLVGIEVVPKREPLAGMAKAYGQVSDAIWVLQPGHEGEAFLTIGQSDGFAQTLAVTYDRQLGVWASPGAAREVRISARRQEVLDTLSLEPEGLKPAELAEAVDRSNRSVRRMLVDMVRDGQVVRQADGRYVLPRFAIAERGSAGAPGAPTRTGEAA